MDRPITMDKLTALADTAAAQIAAYPVISNKDKVKRLIKSSILGQKLAPMDSFSWPNAMLGEGLLAAFERTGNKKYLLAVANHLERWKSAGYPIHYVDNTMNGSLALWIEGLLQTQDVAALFTEKESSQMLALCAEAEKACAGWLHQAKLTEAGVLPYRSQHPDWVFADTLGMVCPFMCRYGAVHEDRSLLDLGMRQLLAFGERGLDSRSGLPYHGYNEKTGMKYGIIGWGRGCGWMLKGLAESLPWIPKTEEAYGRLRSLYQTLTMQLLQDQRPDGGYSWQAEALEGHRDTSAEGMIGTAIQLGLQQGLLEDRDGTICRMTEKLQKAVVTSLTENNVKDCSGECKGFAEYPQVYGSYPWGTGSVLTFLARMKNEK